MVRRYLNVSVKGSIEITLLFFTEEGSVVGTSAISMRYSRADIISRFYTSHASLICHSFHLLLGLLVEDCCSGQWEPSSDQLLILFPFPVVYTEISIVGRRIGITLDERDVVFGIILYFFFAGKLILDRQLERRRTHVVEEGDQPRACKEFMNGCSCRERYLM